MHKLSDLDEYSRQFAKQQLEELWETFDTDDLLQAGVDAGVIEDDWIYEHRCYEPRYCDGIEGGRCGNVDVWRKPE